MPITPYKRQYFKDGQILRGVHLNTVEEGIVALEQSTVPKNQGEENEGKVLVVDSAGNVAPEEIPSISITDIDAIVEGEEENPEVEEASEDGEIDS